MNRFHSDTVADASRERPTEQELLSVVARHRDGVDADTLFKELEGDGHSPSGIRRAVQRALDKRVLVLGSRMRLLAVVEKVAA
jgi:hypothetical protein